MEMGTAGEVKEIEHPKAEIIRAIMGDTLGGKPTTKCIPVPGKDAEVVIPGALLKRLKGRKRFPHGWL
jgi:hypothetical protein